MIKVLTVLSAVLVSTAIDAAPIPFERPLILDFEKSKTMLGYWPRSFAKNVSFARNIGVKDSGAVVIKPGAEGGSFYYAYPGWMYSGGFRTSTPGALTISFDYKLDGAEKAPDMMLNLAFNFDQWAYNDRATHANYAVYSILGEKLRSDFRFVFDTHIRLNKARLNELKVLYIPRMGFIDEKIAAALTDWVKKGGRLVIFDPEFMHKNLDGKAAPARKVLTGLAWPLNRRQLKGGKISYQKMDLPVSELKHFPGPANYPVQAYDMSVPQGAKVVAVYPDGKPAAIERKVGKGSVVYFAVQPFGNSKLAVEPGNWQKFFAAEARRAGEPTGLAKWDYLLESAGDSIKLVSLK